MTWARFDDQFYTHPKLAALGYYQLPCVGLHVLAICWSNATLSDGHIRRSQVFKLCGDIRLLVPSGEPWELVNLLLDAVMWERCREHVDCFLIHDYPDYQPPASQVLAERAEKHKQKVAAGKLGAAARWTPVNGTKHGSQATNRIPKIADAWQKDSPVPVPVPVPVPDVTSSPNGEDVRGATLKERHREVCALWATHHGWPDGKWPGDRRDDAQLIMVWIRDKGYPLELWGEVFAMVPIGARFRWLTTPPGEGKVCRLEEWAIARKDREYAAHKVQETPLALAAGLTRKIA